MSGAQWILYIVVSEHLENYFIKTTPLNSLDSITPFHFILCRVWIIISSNCLFVGLFCSTCSTRIQYFCGWLNVCNDIQDFCWLWHAKYSSSKGYWNEKNRHKHMQNPYERESNDDKHKIEWTNSQFKTRTRIESKEMATTRIASRWESHNHAHSISRSTVNALRIKSKLKTSLVASLERNVAIQPTSQLGNKLASTSQLASK